MQSSDIAGVQRRGSLDRQAGLSFHENPMYFMGSSLDTPEQLIEWNDLCLAWASGWLAEDAGRDKAVQGLLRVESW